MTTAINGCACAVCESIRANEAAQEAMIAPVQATRDSDMIRTASTTSELMSSIASGTGIMSLPAAAGSTPLTATQLSMLRGAVTPERWTTEVLAPVESRDDVLLRELDEFLAEGTVEAAEPVPAPVVPTREEAEAALTKTRLAMMADRGLKMVRMRDCTDHGTYVEWHGYKGNHTVWLTPDAWLYGTESLESYARYYGSTDAITKQKWVGHPTKPLFVKGWFYRDMPHMNRSEYRCYSIDKHRGFQRVYIIEISKDGETVMRSNEGPASSRIELLARRIHRVPQAKVPFLVMKAWFDKVANRLADEGRISLSRSRAMRTRMDQAYLARQGLLVTPSSAIFRTMQVTPGEYVVMRRALRTLGHTIRDNSVQNAREFSALIQALVPEGYTRTNCTRAVINAWNIRQENCDGDDTNQITAADCGHHGPTNDMTYTAHNGYVCEACLDEHYTQPMDSTGWYRTENLYEHEDGYYYTYRENDSETTLVRNYTDNVLRYFGKDESIVPSLYGDFLMGVELETWPKSNRTKAVKHTHEHLCRDYAIMKNDGSLPTGGFEIVTAPRGLAEHVRRFHAWEPFETLRAWDGGKCGLHVHISSQAFSQATLGKFLEFINHDRNNGLIQAIAGRTPSTSETARQYCQREGSLVAANPKRTVEFKDRNRYRMVNTVNMSRTEMMRLGLNTSTSNGKNIDTVELRIFRASLNKKRLLAQLEFAHAAVMFCRQASFRQLDTDTFMLWLRGAAGVYHHLARFLGVKAHTKVVEVGNDILIAEEV